MGEDSHSLGEAAGFTAERPFFMSVWCSSALSTEAHKTRVEHDIGKPKPLCSSAPIRKPNVNWDIAHRVWRKASASPGATTSSSETASISADMVGPSIQQLTLLLVDIHSLATLGHSNAHIRIWDLFFPIKAPLSHGISHVDIVGTEKPSRCSPLRPACGPAPTCAAWPVDAQMTCQ